MSEPMKQEAAQETGNPGPTGPGARQEEFNPPPPETDGQQSEGLAKVSVSRLFFPERMDTLERGAQLQRFRTMIAESMVLSGYPPDAVEQFKNKFSEHPYGSQEWEQDISPWVSFL